MALLSWINVLDSIPVAQITSNQSWAQPFTELQKPLLEGRISCVPNSTTVSFDIDLGVLNAHPRNLGSGVFAIMGLSAQPVYYAIYGSDDPDVINTYDVFEVFYGNIAGNQSIRATLPLVTNSGVGPLNNKRRYWLVELVYNVAPAKLSMRRMWLGPALQVTTEAPMSIAFPNTGKNTRTDAEVPFASYGEYLRRLSLNLNGNTFNFLGYGERGNAELLGSLDERYLNLSEMLIKTGTTGEVIVMPRQGFRDSPNLALSTVEALEIYRTAIYGQIEGLPELAEVPGTPHWRSRLSILEIPN